ncbi:MAG: putative metal-dependent protease of the superfamily [Myxococcales bacterium]|nr:putative metal-dependent protease of the superfamily [Myxococcales bacterium]
MSGSAIDIPRAVLDAVYAHAREGHPEEVCGFLVGAKGGTVADEARRCDNRQNALHAEDPVAFPRDARTAYNIGAKDLFFLDRSQRSERPVKIIYHSHVDVGAYFSAEDERAATAEGELLYPVDYLVVDVQKDGVRGAKLFRFDEGRFVEIGSYGP